MRETPPTRLEIAPCSFASAIELERELGVSHVTAQVLARRGLCDPLAARRFLAAADEHPPAAFEGIERAVAMILRHIEARSQITVHGDYDCDGVCSTAVLVECLRGLGADVDYYLPDRHSDGYGLAAATVERLAARGTRLLITADCAITAVDEVAAARAAGLDVVVTDHHRPRADGLLPDAPIVHPALCGYPCPDLCATGVAAKLATALREAAGRNDPRAAERELELVALATVADVVPLRGENRRFVRNGLRALARTTRPGLRALLEVCELASGAIDERAVGFRLAPRINAAGRLYRPDAGLELLLTDDPARAGALARELDHANAERRDVETRILFEAEAQVASTGQAPAYVLAGEGWHAGVIGIVAARIAERHHRPTVMIGLPAAGGDEPATGSARSVPAFDLLAGLEAASEPLLRFGGHRAAAGLQIRPQDVDGFREAFVAHAAAVLTPADLVAVERIDAIASGEDVTLALAEELAALSPFGQGNPAPTLLLAAAQLADPIGFGGEERSDHVRFTVRSGPARVQAVAFGSGARLPPGSEEPLDAAFRLERDEWRGVVSPRLILRGAWACAAAPVELLGEDEPYMARVRAELEAPLDPMACPPAETRALRDRRDRGIAATLAGAVASGERVLVLCADTRARLGHLRGRLGGFALCSYTALERAPQSSAPFEHVVLLDPPANASEHALACSGAAGQVAHLAWGAPELRFAQHIHEREYGLRSSLVALYRTLRDRGSVAGGELETLLRGEQPQPRSATSAGRLLRVLAELELIELDLERGSVTVVPGRRTQLEASAAFRAYEWRLEDGRRYLGSAEMRAAA